MGADYPPQFGGTGKRVGAQSFRRGEMCGRKIIKPRRKIYNCSIIKNEKYLNSEINTNKNEIILRVKVKFTRGEKLNMLVDSGAQLSFLKLNVIEDKNRINNRTVLKFKGIIGGVRATTVGSIDTGLLINGIFCEHEFHVVDDKVAVYSADGVIGSDFLRKFKAKINYEKKEISLMKPSEIKNELICAHNEISWESRYNNVLARNSVSNFVKNNSNKHIYDRPSQSNGGINFSDGGHGSKVEILKQGSTRMGDSFVSPLGQKRGSDNLEHECSGTVRLKARSENIIVAKINVNEDIVVEKKRLADGV